MQEVLDTLLCVMLQVVLDYHSDFSSLAIFFTLLEHYFSSRKLIIEQLCISDFSYMHSKTNMINDTIYNIFP